MSKKDKAENQLPRVDKFKDVLNAKPQFSETESIESLRAKNKRLNLKLIELNGKKVALEKSDKHFRFAIKNSQIAIFHQNTELIYEWIYNPLSNFKKAATLGKSDYELIPEDLELIQLKEHVLKSCKSKRKIVTASGSYYDVILRPVKENGIVTGLEGVAIDIDDLKKTQNDLIESKKKAEELAKSRKNFLAAMSHEIRTPLNAILGLTDLLIQADPRPDQYQRLQSLLFSSENMMNIVNNILDFSKLESGRFMLRPVNFNLKNLVENLIQSNQPYALKNNNELSLLMDNNLPQIVFGDKVKLSQILNNLLNNALKFTQNGKVELIISQVKNKDNKRVTIHFEINDTGCGISKENIKLIFEQFEQSNDSLTRRVGGTGLGLYMVKMLLQLLGSEIKVKSELGKGTSFYFEIEMELSLEKVKTASAIEPIKVKFDKVIKILLAEDVEENKIMLLQYFEEWENVEIEAVDNGKEALQKASENRYDIILMDMRMPEMDGHEATDLIRNLNDDHYKTIPIIALTADIFATEEESDDNFTDIIVKPFKFKELKEKILMYIEDIN